MAGAHAYMAEMKRKSGDDQMMRHVSAVALLAMAAALSGGGDASAKIRCVGPNQIVGGEPLSTPYCEDNHLAAVAREYGVAVSGSDIRANYNRKLRVCALIGNDIRVTNACGGLRPGDRRPDKRIFN